MTLEWVLRSLPVDGESDAHIAPFPEGLTVALHQNDVVHLLQQDQAMQM